MGEVTGMARIDEKGHLRIDDVAVTIVFIGVLPKIGKESLVKLHHFSLQHAAKIIKGGKEGFKDRFAYGLHTSFGVHPLRSLQDLSTD
jgi:hypothetical protein